MLFNLILPARIQDTITIFLAIIIEATPFIVVGILAVSIMTAFVDSSKLLKLVPRNSFLAHLVSAFLGMIFPVCECGNVPVTRELISKGFTISQSVSFYLGAPILNIAVIATTIAAFSGNPLIIWSRLGGGLLIAVSVGLILQFLGFNSHDNLTEEMQIKCDHNHSLKPEGWNYFFSSKFRDYFVSEFSGMFRFLILGAGIAALTQTWIPREILTGLNSAPVVAITAMILLAVVISVCSTVDAFIALGFASSFSPAAVIAFLLYGPMIDIKAITMLSTTFKTKVIMVITALVTIFTYLISLSLVSLGF